MTPKIKCRIFVPVHGEYREWNSLDTESKRCVTEKCVSKMGDTLNTYFSNNIAAYKAVSV